MYKLNACCKAGLVNGARGTIVAICYKKNKPPELLILLLLNQINIKDQLGVKIKIMKIEVNGYQLYLFQFNMTK